MFHTCETRILKSGLLHTEVISELDFFWKFFYLDFMHINRFPQKNPVPDQPISQLVTQFALSERFNVSKHNSQYRGTQSLDVEQAT